MSLFEIALKEDKNLLNIPEQLMREIDIKVNNAMNQQEKRMTDNVNERVQKKARKCLNGSRDDNISASRKRA